MNWPLTLRNLSGKGYRLLDGVRTRLNGTLYGRLSITTARKIVKIYGNYVVNGTTHASSQRSKVFCKSLMRPSLTVTSA